MELTNLVGRYTELSITLKIWRNEYIDIYNGDSQGLQKREEILQGITAKLAVTKAEILQVQKQLESEGYILSRHTCSYVKTPIGRQRK